MDPKSPNRRNSISALLVPHSLQVYLKNRKNSKFSKSSLRLELFSASKNEFYLKPPPKIPAQQSTKDASKTSNLTQSSSFPDLTDEKVLKTTNTIKNTKSTERLDTLGSAQNRLNIDNTKIRKYSLVAPSTFDENIKNRRSTVANLPAFSFSKKPTFDFEKSKLKFLDSKKDGIARLKYLKQISENCPSERVKDFFNNNYSYIYHLIYDCFKNNDSKYQYKALKSKEDSEIVVMIFEKVLCLLPDLVHRRWQYHSIDGFMRHLLRSEILSKHYNDGLRLFVLWYGLVMDNCDDEAHQLFFHLLSRGNSQLLSNTTASAFATVASLVPSISVNSTLNKVNTELDTYTVIILHQMLVFMVSQVGKVEWSRQEHSFHFLFNSLHSRLLRKLFPCFANIDYTTFNPEAYTATTHKQWTNGSTPNDVNPQLKDVVINWLVGIFDNNTASKMSSSHSQKFGLMFRRMDTDIKGSNIGFQRSIKFRNKEETIKQRSNSQFSAKQLKAGGRSSSDVETTSDSDKGSSNTLIDDNNNNNTKSNNINNKLKASKRSSKNSGFLFTMDQKAIVQKVLFFNKNNFNIIFEILHQVYLGSVGNWELVRNALYIYKLWIKSSEAPIFLDTTANQRYSSSSSSLSSPISTPSPVILTNQKSNLVDPEPPNRTSTNSTNQYSDFIQPSNRSSYRSTSSYSDNSFTQQRLLQVFMCQSSNVFLCDWKALCSQSDSSLLRQQTDLCRRVVNLYRYVVMNKTLRRATWSCILHRLITISCHMIDPANQGLQFPNDIINIVAETLMVTLVRACLLSQLSSQIWALLNKNMASLISSSPAMLHQWQSTMHLLTNMLSTTVYKVDLDACDVKREYQPKQVRKGVYHSVVNRKMNFSISIDRNNGEVNKNNNGNAGKNNDEHVNSNIDRSGVDINDNLSENSYKKLEVDFNSNNSNNNNNENNDKNTDSLMLPACTTFTDEDIKDIIDTPHNNINNIDTTTTTNTTTNNNNKNNNLNDKDNDNQSSVIATTDIDNKNISNLADNNQDNKSLNEDSTNKLTFKRSSDPDWLRENVADNKHVSEASNTTRNNLTNANFNLLSKNSIKKKSENNNNDNNKINNSKNNDNNKKKSLNKSLSKSYGDIDKICHKFVGALTGEDDAFVNELSDLHKLENRATTKMSSMDEPDLHLMNTDDLNDSDITDDVIKKVWLALLSLLASANQQVSKPEVHCSVVNILKEVNDSLIKLHKHTHEHKQQVPMRFILAWALKVICLPEEFNRSKILSFKIICDDLIDGPLSFRIMNNNEGDGDKKVSSVDGNNKNNSNKSNNNDENNDDDDDDDDGDDLGLHHSYLSFHLALCSDDQEMKSTIISRISHLLLSSTYPSIHLLLHQMVKSCCSTITHPIIQHNVYLKEAILFLSSCLCLHDDFKCLQALKAEDDVITSEHLDVARMREDSVEGLKYYLTTHKNLNTQATHVSICALCIFIHHQLNSCAALGSLDAAKHPPTTPPTSQQISQTSTQLHHSFMPVLSSLFSIMEPTSEHKTQQRYLVVQAFSSLLHQSKLLHLISPETITTIIEKLIFFVQQSLCMSRDDEQLQQLQQSTLFCVLDWLFCLPSHLLVHSNQTILLFFFTALTATRSKRFEKATPLTTSKSLNFYSSTTAPPTITNQKSFLTRTSEFIISQLINYNSPCYDDDDDENVGEEDDATKSSSPSPFELVKSKEKDKKLKLVMSWNKERIVHITETSSSSTLTPSFPSSPSTPNATIKTITPKPSSLSQLSLTSSSCDIRIRDVTGKWKWKCTQVVGLCDENKENNINSNNVKNKNINDKDNNNNNNNYIVEANNKDINNNDETRKNNNTTEKVEAKTDACENEDEKVIDILDAILTQLNESSSECCTEDGETALNQAPSLQPDEQQFYQQFLQQQQFIDDHIQQKTIQQIQQNPSQGILSSQNQQKCSKDAPSLTNEGSASHDNSVNLFSKFSRDFGFIQNESRCRNEFLRPGEKLSREIKHLDNRCITETHKVALIYVGKGQRNRKAVLLESQGSNLFKDFYRRIGRLVRLEGHRGFLGGLHKNGSTGLHTVYHKETRLEVIFHVSTLLTPVKKVKPPIKNMSLSKMEERQSSKVSTPGVDDEDGCGNALKFASSSFKPFNNNTDKSYFKPDESVFDVVNNAFKTPATSTNDESNNESQTLVLNSNSTASFTAEESNDDSIISNKSTSSPITPKSSDNNLPTIPNNTFTTNKKFIKHNSNLINSNTTTNVKTTLLNLINEDKSLYKGSSSVAHSKPSPWNGYDDDEDYEKDVCVMKIRHLGNDEVHIVWYEDNNDDNDEKTDYSRYNTDILPTKFGEVIIVIYPQPNGLFRVQIISRTRTNYFGPLYDGALVDWWLLPHMVRLTAINAGRAIRQYREHYQHYFEERGSSIQRPMEECACHMSYEKYLCTLLAHSSKETTPLTLLPPTRIITFADSEETAPRISDVAKSKRRRSVYNVSSNKFKNDFTEIKIRKDSKINKDSNNNNSNSSKENNTNSPESKLTSLNIYNDVNEKGKQKHVVFF